MTPLTQALQETAKSILRQKLGEIIKDYGKRPDDDFIPSAIGMAEPFPLMNVIVQAMQLYHTRLLAEAGRELPGEMDFNRWFDGVGIVKPKAKDAFIMMHMAASALLAAKQGEVDKLNQDIAGKVGVIGNFLEEHDKLKSQLKTAQEEVKSQVMINTIAVVDVRRLENELRESKAEVERLKGCDNAWPLQDVLTKLVDASDYLLHRKDYDGHGHEELLHCVKRGKEIISQLKPQ